MLPKQHGYVNKFRISSETMNSPVVLRVDGLRKAFGGHIVLDGVSFELRRGEIVLLRGDNGSGKTTLLNILAGNFEPDSGKYVLAANGAREEFNFPRNAWQRLNPFDRFVPEHVARKGVGKTWQDIRLFSTLTLLDNVAMATPRQSGENPAWSILRRSKVQRGENFVRSAAGAVLVELGLEGREDSSADMVSLGQAKRVAIARAVQAGATILFLDEPLGGLDMSGISDVMSLLESLVMEKQVTLVIVEHIFNIPRVLKLATTVWTLASGKITVEAPLSIRRSTGEKVPDTVNIWLKKIAGEGGQIVDRQLCGGAFLSTAVPIGAESNPVILELNDVAVHRNKRLVVGSYRENNQLHGLSFEVRKGHVAVIQAPNGWGKTTLLEALAGLIPISQGAIRLNSCPIETMYSWERVQRGLSFLQARNRMFPRLTVREALRLARVAAIPEDLNRMLDRRVADLSGGEEQKLAGACAINNDRFSVGLLDEPFSALDSAGVDRMGAQLSERLSQAGFLVTVPSSL